MSKCISLITTYQTPHIEDLMNCDEYLTDFRDFEFVDIAFEAPIRVELPFQDGLRSSASKLYNNYLRKKIFMPIMYGNKLKRLSKSRKNGKTKPFLSYEEILNTFFSFYYLKDYDLGTPVNSENLLQFILLAQHVEVTVNEITTKYSKSDSFLIFNGRLPFEYLLKKALQKAGYENILNLELAEYRNAFVIRKADIHDLPSYSQEICEIVTKIPPKDVNEKFLKLAQKLNRNFRSKDNRTIYDAVLFTSSLDEYYFYLESIPNYFQVIEELIKNAIHFEVSFVVRVHPLTAIRSVRTKYYWMFLKAMYPDNIILWDERVNSFDLIEETDLVITYGSSLTAYAVAKGKQTLLVDMHNLYINLEMCENSSFKQIQELCSERKNVIRTYLKKTNIPNSTQIEYAKAAFIYEQFIGFDRTHELISKNIKHTALVFMEGKSSDIQLSDERLKCIETFVTLCDALASFLNNINFDETHIQAKCYFRIEHSESYDFKLLIDDEKTGVIYYDSLQSLKFWLSKTNCQRPDFRSIPEEFFLIKGAQQLVALAYESLVIRARIHKKCGFAEAFYYWRDKYNNKFLELENYHD